MAGGGAMIRRPVVPVVLGLFLAATCGAGVALAVPPGLTIEFDGNGEGKVLFRGGSHAEAGAHCADCHFELFDVSRSSQITRADHRKSASCFNCHDGKQTFAARANCDRCHEDEQQLTAGVTSP